ncbi:AzlC family ABC transporter permease [Deinococcus actinosclerus]|uniref:Branched-chain amino acid permease n=1 Tax=Deinococcus actinosclerus TaxID=1768108 RepID=A0ABM5X4G3_9DEIO|nr:AzlC family ABC transporter permease [Deinococcus actinosclerus]ALW88494.1 branched-chain amino acid permease [Deinococcus actinosclerus]
MTGQGRGFDWAAFGRGFRVMVPLWAGVVPFAVAYAVTARTNGLSVWETCLMSVTVFAGASQFAAAGQFVAGGVAGVASALALVGTTFVLNARHVLYGLSLSRQLPLSRLQRAVAAQFLTDEAYGMVLVAGPRDPGGLSLGFLLGAELSLFAAWNAATLLGALAGAALPDPDALGVGVIFPLAFLGLLVPLLLGRVAVLVALASGLGAWGLGQLLPGGLVVLLVGVGGALLGALISTRAGGRA